MEDKNYGLWWGFGLIDWLFPDDSWFPEPHNPPTILNLSYITVSWRIKSTACNEDLVWLIDCSLMTADSLSPITPNYSKSVLHNSVMEDKNYGLWLVLSLIDWLFPLKTADSLIPITPNYSKSVLDNSLMENKNYGLWWGFGLIDWLFPNDSWFFDHYKPPNYSKAVLHNSLMENKNYRLWWGFGLIDWLIW
jgi:hypothetical protein